MIRRDLPRMAARAHDLVVIGGGIHGAMVALGGARRGLGVALLEARDFGSGASGNSLRILHGGLRYLQTLDLSRFRQSVRARARFVRDFPDLVRPLSCLMPLYGEGLKSIGPMRAALAANDLLSSRRNSGIESSLALPPSKILSPEEALAMDGAIRPERLQGAAQWHDYAMLSSERILIETLNRATALRAQIANYASVSELVTERNAVRGVVVRDEWTGSSFEVRAPVVVNCTGGEGEVLAKDLGAPAPGLFVPSVAFNVLLDVRLKGANALAVAAPNGQSPVYFLVPGARATLAGTVHAAREPGTTDAIPAANEIESFLTDLRRALPSLDVDKRHVRRVFAGLLPAKAPRSTLLSKREAIVNHGRFAGPHGFWSIAGIKFTTSHEVAEAALSRIFPGQVPKVTEDRTTSSMQTAHKRALADADAFMRLSDAQACDCIRRLVDDEAVFSSDDLILRRTNWCVTEPDLEPIAARISPWIERRADSQTIR